MNFFECSGAVVSWDPAVKCVVLRFRGYIEGDDLRNASLSVLKLLEMHRANKVLTDSRDMHALTQEDQRWLDVEWKAKATATGVAYNALVLPKSTIAKLTVNAVMKKIPNEIQIAYFSTPEEANKWLSSR
ncbi:MAG TPA: STAS/SEC14 domain-containing protein [Polyangiaceae bacterium]|nr:STAS/SEC14 domain-containing protein [Polyangiaceae bacterium]